MRSFFEWFGQESVRPEDPWLILGKGPSYSKKSQFDCTGYRTLSLNHVVREEPVTAAHIIDLEVIEPCADAIEKNARVLVMPWIPQRNGAPQEHTLERLAQTVPVLGRMNEQNRLLWYNLVRGPVHRPDSPIIDVGFFSSEAALNLLAAAGVRRVRSLGIDGGAKYSPKFDDLKDKTLLQSRWKTFDHQFAGIARTISTTGIDYAPLDVPSPIRVYVGAVELHMLAVKVLEYSIRKHASMSVEVLPMHLGVPIPEPKEARNRPHTPFSYQRFTIPELAGYDGRGIYLDSDMQVFRDIRALWTLPFDDAWILAAPSSEPGARRPQFSVMLLDCERLRWNIRDLVRALDEGTMTYDQLMYGMAATPPDRVRQSIDPAWNSLESYRDGETALVHYTDLPTQPWTYREHPLCHLWMRDLFEGLDRGLIKREMIEDHVRRGWVRPSLLYQVDHRIEDGLLLPRQAIALDRAFRYPTDVGLGRAWLRPFLKARSILRHWYRRSGLAASVRRLKLWLGGIVFAVSRRLRNLFKVRPSS